MEKLNLQVGAVEHRNPLNGKVSIVTGGSSGIGKSIVELFLKNNIQVVVADKKVSYNGFFVKCDVSKYSDVRNVVRKTIEKFGRIDFLVNNAGIRIIKPLSELSENKWDNLINVNLKGAFLFSKEVLKYMKTQKSGVIVNMSSINGKYGVPNLSAYCASKFGLIGLTESLAEEVEKYGIKVFAICPYPVNTETYRKLYPKATIKNLISQLKVAKGILDLCNPLCKLKTGSSLIIKKGILDIFTTS